MHAFFGTNTTMATEASVLTKAEQYLKAVFKVYLTIIPERIIDIDFCVEYCTFRTNTALEPAFSSSSFMVLYVHRNSMAC